MRWSTLVLEQLRDLPFCAYRIPQLSISTSTPPPPQCSPGPLHTRVKAEPLSPRDPSMNKFNSCNSTSMVNLGGLGGGNHLHPPQPARPHSAHSSHSGGSQPLLSPGHSQQQLGGPPLSPMEQPQQGSCDQMQQLSHQQQLHLAMHHHQQPFDSASNSIPLQKRLRVSTDGVMGAGAMGGGGGQAPWGAGAM